MSTTTNKNNNVDMPPINKLAKPKLNVNTNLNNSNHKVSSSNVTPTSDWSTHKKRNRSNSSYSNSDSPTSPQMRPTKSKKKLFITNNRYEVLSSMEQSVEPPAIDPQDTNLEPDAPSSIKPPPPIFIKHVRDFPELCTELCELIGVDNFHCKSTPDQLKIQTTNPEAYRTLVKFLRNENAQFHTFQLKEDKPTRVVIHHSSVLLSISATPSVRIEPPKLFSPLTNRKQFHDLIKEKINLNIKLKSNTDIDEAVYNLTNLIQSTAWSTTKPDINRNLKPKPHFLPEEIRNLIVEKRRARARYQASHLPSHKIKYNKLANSLKKVLAKHKSNTFEQKLHKLSAADGSLWRETKRLLNYKSISTPLRKEDNSLAISDPEKSAVFQSHLSNIFQPHADIVDNLHMSNVKKFLDSPLPIGPPTKFYTPNEEFDRVWHDGFLFKLRNFLPSSLFLLIKSYLTDRYFQIRLGSCTSDLAPINAGVPQGAILSPLLFNIYSSDQPTSQDTLVADYADDKAIMSIHENPVTASANLQSHLDQLSQWYTKWRIKLNHRVVALQEIRWNDKGTLDLQDTTIFYGECNDRRQFGTGFAVHKSIVPLVTEFKSTNPRISILTIKGKFFDITFLNGHAPTEEKTPEEKDDFYENLEQTLN
ncbi:hypothetical protein QTP88_002957 [Uroleucon formosanum]